MWNCSQRNVAEHFDDKSMLDLVMAWCVRQQNIASVNVDPYLWRQWLQGPQWFTIELVHSIMAYGISYLPIDSDRANLFDSVDSIWLI